MLILKYFKLLLRLGIIFAMNLNKTTMFISTTLIHEWAGSIGVIHDPHPLLYPTKAGIALLTPLV